MCKSSITALTILTVGGAMTLSTKFASHSSGLEGMIRPLTSGEMARVRGLGCYNDHIPLTCSTAGMPSPCQNTPCDVSGNTPVCLINTKGLVTQTQYAETCAYVEPPAYTQCAESAQKPCYFYLYCSGCEADSDGNYFCKNPPVGANVYGVTPWVVDHDPSGTYTEVCGGG